MCALLKNIAVPKDSKMWDYHAFKKELKGKLEHYPDFCRRLTDIITTYYRDYFKRPEFCSTEQLGIRVDQKNILAFMNNLTVNFHSDVFYYLIHGNLDGYERSTKGDEKTRLLHNLESFWDAKDKTPKTNNDALLCKLLTFYLAIKILRNKMSHAAENIDSRDTELKEFLNLIEGTDDIEISLFENDIHTLLIRAMKYSREAQKTPFKKSKLAD